MKRVLITDDCHPILKDGLHALGYVCDDEPDIVPAEVASRIGDYAGLIINSKILVDQNLLDAAVLLEFVGRLGSGMEIVDKAYAASRGVGVLSSPEGNRNAVAEQALGMLLALANNLTRADREVRQRTWRREANRGFELEGRTLGIIGFGHTGSRLASKLPGWGMTILAYDKYLAPGYAAALPWVRETSLEDLRDKSDVISLHLPLTPETRHLVDRSFLKACKPGMILVNTARGACVRTSDLVEALETGHVGGACLDVFENEKPERYTPEESALYERLFNLPQTVLTPHVAGWTHESKRKLAEVLLEKITHFLSAKKRE